MPRKPSEIDVIDGIIFQSFETSEGMEGCFQYTGPNLPVKVRRTSRERKTKFRVKEGILSPKKKPLLPGELQTPEQLYPAANSSSVKQSASPNKKSPCQHCSSYSPRYKGSPTKAKRKLLDVGVGECSDCFVSETDSVPSDYVDFEDQVNLSSDSMPVLSEELYHASSSSSQDADSMQESSDQVDEILVKYHSPQATQNTKKKMRKKKKRKRLNNMYHGVKFGSLSCRIKGKSKKKTNKASCTVTSLGERESNSCQDDSLQSHWMTPPDGQNNAKGSSGLRISLKKVTRELMFEPGEKTEDQWVGVTSCTSPDKKQKRKKKKQKKKLKLLEAESFNNSSNNSLSARTDGVEPQDNNFDTNLGTGDLKLVEDTKKRPAFQKSLPSVDNGYSVMLSPELMDMPTLTKEHESALEPCLIPPNNHFLSSSVVKSGTKAEESYSAELERLLTSTSNLTPQSGSGTQVFATSKSKRKKTPSKKQAVKKPRRNNVKMNATSPLKDRSGKGAKQQNRSDCHKNNHSLCSLDAGTDSDHVEMPPVLTPQRQLKGRKRYTQNHLDIGPDLSPPRLSPAFATGPSSAGQFVYPESEFNEQMCKLPIKRETSKKAAKGKKKLKKMQKKHSEPPSINQESVVIKCEQTDQDFLPCYKSQPLIDLVSSDDALEQSHGACIQTDPRCRANANQSQHQLLDVSQDKNHSEIKPKIFLTLPLPRNTSSTMHYLRDHTSSTACDMLNRHTSSGDVKRRGGKRERRLSIDAALDKVKPSKKKKQKRASVCTLMPSGTAFTGNTFNSTADEHNTSSLNSLLNVKEKQSSVGKNHTKVESVPYLSPRCVPKRTIKRPARYEQDKADSESKQKPYHLVKESPPLMPCDSSISPSSSPKKQRRNSASYQRPSAKKKRKASLDVIAHLQYSSASGVHCQEVQEMCVTSSTTSKKLKLLTRTVSLQVPDDLKTVETLSSREQKPSLKTAARVQRQNHSMHPRGKVNDLCSTPCTTGLPPGGKSEKSSGGTQTSDIDFYLADFNINYPN